MPSLEHHTSAVATLAWIARYRAIAKKSTAFEARDFMASQRVPEVVQRAAIGAGSTADSTLGSEGITVGQWADSARTTSVFYRILADGAFARVPFKARVALMTSAPTGAVVAEGKSVPVSRIRLNNVSLEPVKVNALLAVTDELLLATGSDGQSLFNRELLSVISAAVDTAFVDAIDTGTTPITSTSPMPDLRAALLAVGGGYQQQLARLYWLASTDVAKLGSTLGTAKGGLPLQATSATGGEMAGLPMLVSSGVPSGTLYLVDASGIAANGEAPTIEASSAASVQMDTAPTGASDVPTATSVVSMFQTNSTALKSTAVVAFQKLRADAVAVVTGITSTTWAAT